LFTQDAEKVHDRFTKIGKSLGDNYFSKLAVSTFLGYENKMLEQNVDGVSHKNPIGLAAGFDKDANLTQILPSVGFGHMEVGSITNKPYEGNPQPRLTRLPSSKSIIVYYGLKNEGVTRIVGKLSDLRSEIPLGVSVAKTNSDDTATKEGGIKDYFECFKKVAISGVGDYVTINVSCPNTFGGEPFTDRKSLEKLFKVLKKVKFKKPLYVKMPIEKTKSEFGELCEVLVKYKVNGVIIGNLAKSRDNSALTKKDKMKAKRVQGGLSGKATWDLSNNLISHTYKNFGKKLTVIGCGGVFSAEDAFKKITLGASLVQLITGMIYEGPQLIGDINHGLVKLTNENGFKNIKEATGTNSNP